MLFIIEQLMTELNKTSDKILTSSTFYFIKTFQKKSQI